MEANRIGTSIWLKIQNGTLEEVYLSSTRKLLLQLQLSLIFALPLS